MRSKILLAAVLAVAVFAVGCGGDDETTTTTTAGTSGASGASGASGQQGSVGVLPEDFAADANAICKSGDEALNDAFGQLGPDTSAKQVTDIVKTKVVPVIQGQIDDLKDLGEPDEGADEYNQLLEDAQSALDQLEEDPSGLIDSGTDPFKDVNKQAKELGLDDCS